MQPTLDRIREIAADVLGVPAASLSADSGPETVEAWDSVQHLSLVLAIEQAYELEFPPDEVDAMKTLGGFAAAIERRRNRAPV